MIIGQPLAVALLERWLAKQTTQPLLLYGPEGVGKRSLALEAAQALNCRESPRLGGCGKCLSCGKIAGGKHPDVRLIDMSYQAAVRGEPLEKQQSLRIETVLEERRRLYQTPGEGLWKVTLLDEAHRLTPEAANVLLKILEEPPPRTAIFLLTPHRDRLFSTLTSRCQPVRFRALSDDEMRECLSQRGAGKPSAFPGDVSGFGRLIELAGGSPGRALRMNRSEQIQAAVEAEALWEELPRLTPGEIVAKQGPRARTPAANRADVEAQLQLLLAPALRELRARRPGAPEKVNLLQNAQQQLRQNVPSALVYEHLLLKLSTQRKP